MAQTFFFYDLETSGVNPRSSRIMQFAGQRTDMDLEPIGEPVNIIIKLTPDIVPEPDAIMITGITPQQTLQDGITEAEFAEIFCQEIAIPGTIFTGFNSVRFDDEFMRFFLYRNFRDAYEWQWKHDCSRWDMLDVVRMTRALRPDGITWPFDSSGKPSNRLELLTSVNKLEHTHAHDALSDVYATIAVARLIRDKQAKLFQYLLDMRSKKKVTALIKKGEPFVYSSGKYPAEYEKTAVVLPVVDHPKRQGTYVYDLRHDPTEYLGKTPEQLAELWKYKKDSKEPRLPVKLLQINRCPAIAPLGVLDDASRDRLQIDLHTVQKHAALLQADQTFADKICKAVDIMDTYQQAGMVADIYKVDGQLYDGFFPDQDVTLRRALVVAEPADIATIAEDFKDERLRLLAKLYKARNFERALNDEERQEWEQFKAHSLTDGGQKSRLAVFFARLSELAADETLSGEKQYLLEELQLYGQSIMPVYDESDAQQSM
jgi:exodeoxyribonuclease I